MSEEKKMKEASAALKYLGNVGKKKLHKLATKDLFEDGFKLLKKNIKKIRKKALRRKKKEISTHLNDNQIL